MTSTAATAGADVKLEAVSRRYQVASGKWTLALDAVSLAIPPNAAVAISGPSGSGKSTLLHLVGAMDNPDTGAVRVDGTEVNRLPRKAQAAYRGTIGFVFQRFHLLPALTVLDNVVAPLLPYRTTFDRFARGRELLAAVGLAGKERTLPSQLSGGEQQRVAIARALVNSPRLLLADEPTGNLDSTTGAEILRLLLDFRAEHGMTVILATHDPLVVSRCDRVIRLGDGRVIDDIAVPRNARPDDLLDRIARLGPSQ